MNFVLQPIYDESDHTITRDIKQPAPNEINDNYDDMVTSNKEPSVSSVDKKRMNKSTNCPKCGKSMTKKTLTYSHDCEKIKQQTIKTSSITEVNTPVTDEQVELYLQKQQAIDRDTLISQKRERFDNMIKNIF